MQVSDGVTRWSPRPSPAVDGGLSVARRSRTPDRTRQVLSDACTGGSPVGLRLCEAGQDLGDERLEHGDLLLRQPVEHQAPDEVHGGPASPSRWHPGRQPSARRRPRARWWCTPRERPGRGAACGRRDGTAGCAPTAGRRRARTSAAARRAPRSAGGSPSVRTSEPDRDPAGPGRVAPRTGRVPSGQRSRSRPGSPSPPTSRDGSYRVNRAVVPSSRASAAAFSRAGSARSSQ